MFITFLNGRRVEAQIYQGTETTLRVAVQGREGTIGSHLHPRSVGLGSIVSQ